MSPPRPRTREEFWEFLGQYVAASRLQAIREELALTRFGAFRAPEKILIILFPSRSGSTFFGQLLSSTGWFNQIGESFAPRQLNAVRQRQGLGDLHEAAQWMIDNRGTEHAFGVKAGFKVLAASAELGFLPEIIDRAQFLLLRRRDRVGQAVSMVKGLRGGKMHSGQSAERQLTDDDYDADAIAQKVENIIRTEVMLAEFASRLGKDAPLVYYEDICADPRRYVAQVCDLMGLKMPSDYEPNKVRLSVVRDELSARWVQRFRTERPALN
jgi:LPS sulfotransferase NodH